MFAGAVELFPRNPGILSEGGALREVQKRYPEAQELFERALAAEPGNTFALYGKLSSLRLQWRLNEAESLIKTALQQFPTDPNLLNERGWLYLTERQYDNAVETFDNIIKNNPVNDFTLRGKISALSRQNRFDETNTTLKDALKRFPENVNVLSEGGWAYHAQKRYSEGQGLFDRALAIEPANEFALSGKIASLRLQRRFGEAETQGQGARTRLPNSAAILTQLGAVNYDEACYDDAEETFRKVVEIEPNEPAYQTNLAWALARQGSDAKFNEAIDLCKEALELDPESAQALGCRGVIAFNQGHMAEAEDYLRLSIKADPQVSHVDLAGC